MQHDEIPKVIPIKHDDDHAKHVGRLPDGRQFFLTAAFRPATKDDPGCEFIALYLFDSEGALVESFIDRLGPRATLNEADWRAAFQRRLGQLEGADFCSIAVAPFKVEAYGTDFGLIPMAPEEPGEVWTVILMPGNFMAFFPPWDGEYYT